VAITTDYQAEIRGLTVGAGTPFEFSGPIAGLGTPTPRTADAERGDLDGDVGGDDVLPRRILTLPLNVDAATPAALFALVADLKAAWRPSPVDVAFDLRLPGFPSSDGILRFYGRPRGLELELAAVKNAHADALLTFEALDPFGYGPEETVALGGATVVTNDGSAVSDRWTLALTGGGGTVTFENTNDDEPALALAGAAGTELLDGRARTITAGGTDAYAVKAPGGGWPLLVAGTNAVTLTGATGNLTFRPAWQ